MLRGPQTVLTETFGYDSFRPGQDEAVQAVCAGRDAIVVLPTGAGKSLCYQVPAIGFAGAGRGTTIVVSPLIALMNDQVSALRGRGVAAAALHSHLDDVERQRVWAQFRAGSLSLLYVSPERAVLPGFKSWLARIPIACLAIDEVHCVSQWGHDFRPEYMRLSELREHIEVPTVGLTATATPQVVTEIVDRLALRNPVYVRGDFRRPNLTFSVEHHRGDAPRIARMLRILDELGFRDRASPGRCIVYCTTRKKSETVAKALRDSGFSAGYYHAGRTALARERAQRAFELGRVRILVATNAFGMGIDYPNVRLTLHFQAPGSLAAYYQEAGRAGRDRQASRCVLFYGEADMMTQRRLNSDATSATRSQQLERELAAVRDYTYGSQCRQQALCEYFTGNNEHPPCELCDACCHTDLDVGDGDAVPTKPAEAQPLPEDHHQLIVDAVGGLSKPVGKSNLARALRGSRAKAVQRLGLLGLPQHGKLKWVDERSIVATIEHLIENRVLERRGNKYPTVWLRGRPVRSAAAEARGTTSDEGETPAAAKARSRRQRARKFSDVRRVLDNYRRRKARTLKWKPYMVFQKRAIIALDEQRPTSLKQLEAIPGLGPAKIERFGLDILELIRDNQ